MPAIFNSILETVGNTPIVKLNHVVPKNSPHTFWAKIESFNPGSSVKDRIAMAIIEEAEKRGELKPGGTIIEATSGNTGLGLALVAAVKGYKTIFVMPDKISEEKRAILRAYGAKVVITPTAVEPDDPRSFYSVAAKLVEITPNSFYANQYHNQDNTNRHYRSTGPEIWEQTEGQVDVFVAGAGTGGTISGVGRFLKEKKPEIKVLCPDPIGSILYDLFYYKEIREPARPYKVEGVGEDMVPSTLHMDVIDDFVQVGDKESFEMTRELIAKEGLCVGPSSAMNLVGAIKYAETLKKPSNILVMMPDNGRAYLSKAFNDNWMRENDFLPSPLKSHTVSELVAKKNQDTELVVAQVGESVIEVANKMKQSGVSQLPIYSDKELVGMLNETDLLDALVRGAVKPNEPVIHLVKDNVEWIDSDQNLESLNQLLKDGKVALVRNQNKVSILTHTDLLDFLGDIKELR